MGQATNNNKAGAAKSYSDFNDLHVTAGLQVVREQLLAALEAGPVAVLERPEPKAAAAPPATDDIPLSAYTDAPEERQPYLGGIAPPGANDKAAPLGLPAALERFFYLAPSGGVWDSKLERIMKKTAFRDFVTASVAKQWLEHPDRKGMTDDQANRYLAAQRAASKPTREPSWQDRFQRNDNGDIRADIANAKLVLDNDPRWDGVLGYCRFSYRIMKRRDPPFANGVEGEWTDTDTDRLRIWLSEKYGFTPKNADALGAVVVCAEGSPFHPVREYLSSIMWDEKPRVKQWLTNYLGAEASDYHSLVGQMWLIGAIARVMQPPVKVDNVIIFEGLQGLGKSTTLSILAGEWFTDTPLEIGAKDGFQQMQGVWVIELAELDSFNKAESTRAKQFFGASVDKYRPSYGRMVQAFARQCVFAGSTNQEAYFKDASGNRRYWPVKCTAVHKNDLQRDRDQLWAEAFEMYQQGVKWWPPNEYKHLFEAEQDDRFEEDVWQEPIETFLRNTTKERVTAYDIMSDALGMLAGNMKPPEQKRIGQILMRLGWQKRRARVNGGRGTAYDRPADWGQPPPDPFEGIEEF